MYYDKDKADNVVKFFRNLSHTKGHWRGVPFTVLPWQEQALRDIFGTVRESGARQYTTAYLEVAKKMGKALAVDTPIPTPCGWKSMGDLQAGDHVFDENGDPCKVIRATEVMFDRRCYEVCFSDGRSIVADAEHQWKTKSYETKRKNGKRFKLEDYIHTTESIRETVNVSWYANKGLVCRNHAIEYHKGLRLPDKDLPIAPYLLGAWLGDGSSYNASIVCAYKDYAVIEHIKALGVPVREGVSSNKNTGQFGLTNGDRLHPGDAARSNTINAKLRELNLLKNKHIPEVYKRASYDQRLELLQGLMDTDGHIEKCGLCEYTTVNQSLAADVRDIVNGLGIKANVSVGDAMLSGRRIGEKYRVQFYAYADVPVAKLARKQVNQKTRPKKPTRNAYVQITNVRPVDSVPVKCIEVDSPSNLYLAGHGYIPTHNSEIGAGVGLYCLTSDDEYAAEVYGCAADRQQASIVFDVAVDMVDQNRALKKHIRPILSQKRLVYLPTKSFYQVLSADVVSKHGFNVHAVVFDELHAQPNRGLYDVMTQGSGDARRQPLFFIITTAGDDPDRASIGWEVHKRAEEVLLGTKTDPTLYAMIYGLDRDNRRIWGGRTYETAKEDWGDRLAWQAVWSDPKVWAKVNPSLGHTITLEKVHDHYVQAEGNLALEKNFRWLRLNCWEKIKTSGWLGLDFWDLCKGKVDVKRLRGRPCYGGLDLSSKIDMTSFVLLFPPDDINTKWQMLAYYWLPEDAIRERHEVDKVPYPEWVQRGLIHTTPGNVIDYGFIEKFILDLREEFDIREIGFDPWNALQTAVTLGDEGLTMVEVRQGTKTMSAPMKEIEQLVRGRKLVHSGHDVLRWNIGNVQVKIDENENVRPVKGKGVERIDGLVAAINAMSRALLHKEDSSVYEQRGVLTV